MSFEINSNSIKINIDPKINCGNSKYGTSFNAFTKDQENRITNEKNLSSFCEVNKYIKNINNEFENIFLPDNPKWADPEFCLYSIKINPMNFRFIKKQTKLLFLEAFRRDKEIDVFLTDITLKF